MNRFSGLERWRRGKDHLLFFQKQVQFPAPTLDSSYPSVTPFPGDPALLWPQVLAKRWCTYLHAGTHTTQAHKFLMIIVLQILIIDTEN